MNSQNTADDFDYLNEVLRSDLPDKAKRFFIDLVARPAFRCFFWISNSLWDSDALHSIELLEKASFLTVVRNNDRVRYVSHRRCGKSPAR